MIGRALAVFHRQTQFFSQPFGHDEAGGVIAVPNTTSFAKVAWQASWYCTHKIVQTRITGQERGKHMTRVLLPRDILEKHNMCENDKRAQTIKREGTKTEKKWPQSTIPKPCNTCIWNVFVYRRHDTDRHSNSWRDRYNKTELTHAFYRLLKRGRLK